MIVEMVWKFSFFIFFLFLDSSAKGFLSKQELLLQNIGNCLQASSNLYSLSKFSSDETDESPMITTKRSSKYLLNNDKGESGIRNIVDDYDVFLLDMWGVMHDGKRPYEGVLDVVKKLRQAGKKLIILSNSSKRRSNSVKVLQKLEFSPLGDFDDIITSGEIAHHLLKYLSGEEKSSWVPKTVPPVFEKFRDKGGELSAFCFGSGDGDVEYLNSSGWTLSDSIENADLIVARGTFVVQSGSEFVSKKEDGELAYMLAYLTALEKAAAASIPMIVCNPDKVRPDADNSPMPGTIGLAYQKQLNKRYGSKYDNDDDNLILSLGKPFSNVYDIALSKIDNIDKSRVVMVGDALETDVTGATASEIDSIWVTNDGIHNKDIVSSSKSSSQEEGCEAVIREFNNSTSDTYAQRLNQKNILPTVVIPHFRW